MHDKITHFIMQIL